MVTSNKINGYNNISLEEICKILEIEKEAPVIYESGERVNAESLIYTNWVTKDSENVNENNSYEPIKEGIHIPLLDVEQFYNIKRTGNYRAVDKIVSEIDNKLGNCNEKKLAYCIFCILHELGHWKNCCELGPNAKQFFRQDDLMRAEIDDCIKRLDRIKSDAEKMIRLDILNEKYRKIPSEQVADQYAFDQLEDAFNFVKEKLKL